MDKAGADLYLAAYTYICIFIHHER